MLWSKLKTDRCSSEARSTPSPTPSRNGGVLDSRIGLLLIGCPCSLANPLPGVLAVSLHLLDDSAWAIFCLPPSFFLAAVEATPFCTMSYRLLALVVSLGGQAIQIQITFRA
jgi:hypothetical protein